MARNGPAEFYHWHSINVKFTLPNQLCVGPPNSGLETSVRKVSDSARFKLGSWAKSESTARIQNWGKRAGKEQLETLTNRFVFRRISVEMRDKSYVCDDYPCKGYGASTSAKSSGPSGSPWRHWRALQNGQPSLAGGRVQERQLNTK